MLGNSTKYEFIEGRRMYSEEGEVSCMCIEGLCLLYSKNGRGGVHVLIEDKMYFTHRGRGV